MRTPACIRIAHPHSRTDNLYRSGGNETIKRTNQIIHTFTLRLLYFPAHEKRTKIDINITNTRCNLYRIPQSNAVCGANSNHFVWSSHTRRIQTPIHGNSLMLHDFQPSRAEPARPVAHQQGEEAAHSTVSCLSARPEYAHQQEGERHLKKIHKWVERSWTECQGMSMRQRLWRASECRRVVNMRNVGETNLIYIKNENHELNWSNF